MFHYSDLFSRDTSHVASDSEVLSSPAFDQENIKWLIVAGSDYAKPNGAGTINGDLAPKDEEYGLMSWAGDVTAEDGADTLRIKAWYEEDDTEYAVFDNSMDKAIGPGNIVMHMK